MPLAYIKNKSLAVVFATIFEINLHVENIHKTSVLNPHLRSDNATKMFYFVLDILTRPPHLELIARLTSCLRFSISYL